MGERNQPSIHKAVLFHLFTPWAKIFKCLFHDLKPLGSQLSLPKANIDFVYAVGMQSPCLRRKVKLHECFCLYRLQIISLSHTHTQRMSLILRKIKSLNNSQEGEEWGNIKQREKRKILKLPQCTLHIIGTKGISKCGERCGPYADVKNWKYIYWGEPRLSVIHMNTVSFILFNQVRWC